MKYISTYTLAGQLSDIQTMLTASAKQIIVVQHSCVSSDIWPLNRSFALGSHWGKAAQPQHSSVTHLSSSTFANELQSAYILLHNR